MDGTILEIDKSFENNLRERNPQLGRVEGVPDGNVLGLVEGDVVAVNHFTFYGDIGANKSFKLQDHFVHDGKMIFRATLRQMFFKYNDKTPECFEDYILCEKHTEPEEHFGVYFGDKTTWVCTHGCYVGSEVVTLKNAPYLITLDRKEYYKVRKDEVVWAGGVVGENMLVRILPDKEHSLYTIKTNNQTAIALTSLGEVMIGDTIQIWKNQGVETPDGYVVGQETIIGIWTDQSNLEITKLQPTT